MGIVDTYKKKLQDARIVKENLRNLSGDFPDKVYILMNLDNQIMEYERRIESLTSLGHSTQCDECKQWILHEERDTVSQISGYHVCSMCKGAITKVLMSHEAEKKWSLPTGTIKQDCRRGTLDIFIENNLIRKSGKYWLIHDVVGKLYYEKRKSHD